MKVYLAGPIDDCSDAECYDWRIFVTQELFDHKMINPMRRDYRGQELSSINEIVVLDKLDIQNCDVFFANCPKPSIGTAMELLHAYSFDKIIITVIPIDETPSPWLIYHSTKIFTSLKEAVNWIDDNL